MNLSTELKTHEPVHVKHGKCIFVPKGEHSRMRTTNLNLMMQKGNRVVQMIITIKSCHTCTIYFYNTYLKDEIKKLSCVGSGTQYTCMLLFNILVSKTN